MAAVFAGLSVGAFFLGSLPTAYIFAKKFKGIDIRKHGSGNVGATNAGRVLGKPFGITVFAIDFLKGAAPVLVARFVLHIPEDRALWIGFAAILGHVFTPFLGFKGGKGIATGIGVIFAAYPPLGLVMVLFWIVLLKVFKMVSISSMISLFLTALVSFLTGRPIVANFFFLSLALFSVWTHRENIQRIVSKSENKVA
jgi:glycerol-3-phosphate acyltransferase PlsY